VKYQYGPNFGVEDEHFVFTDVKSWPLI